MSTLVHTLPQAHAGSVAVRADGTLKPHLAVRIGKSVWHSLERMGHRRASHALMQLANQYASTQPELAANLREAARFDPFQ